MKKLFVILIALALLVGVSAPAFAAEADTITYTGGNGLGSLRAVTCVNNTANVTTSVIASAEKYISSTFTEPGVTPGKVKIIGYDIFCMNAAAAGWAAIFDGVALASGDVIAEAEAFTGLAVSRIFPMGMNLKYGLFIQQGAYSSVTVYYVQDIP